MLQILSDVAPIVLILALAACWLMSGLWAAKDAESRGKSGVLVSLLVLFVGWPLSILVWIALRPDDDSAPFDLQRFRH